MWTVRLSEVPERVTHRAVCINGRVYSFDSYYAARNFVDVFVFDPALQRWDSVQMQLSDGGPINISRHTIVAYGHCAYLWGGPHSWPSPSFLYRFDTDTMTCSCPEVFGEAPTSIYGNTACVVGHRMYIFGVLDHSHYMRVLDLDTMEWLRVPTSGEAPVRRAFHTASAIGTRMYVWGGSLADPFLPTRVDNSLYYLETSTSSWVRPQVQGVPPVGRRGHSAFVYKGELYVFGGYSDVLRTYLADMHKYDPETSCWSEVKPWGSAPSARYWHGCSVMGERVFIFCGYGPTPDRNEGQPAGERTALRDLHVLHMAPTLKNLCLLAAIDARLDLSRLPRYIRDEVGAITSHP